MNRVLDDALVGVLLAASVAYAVYSLGPRAWRPRLLGGAAALLGRLPRFLGVRATVGRLERAAAAKSTGSCGGCDNCGSEPAVPGQPPSAGQFGTPAEVSVPLSTIGKRNSG
jgi:hypothetical protein